MSKDEITLPWEQAPIYEQATDLSKVSYNFEPELELLTGPKGKDNVFYVQPPNTATEDLIQGLLATSRRVPKRFFSGHRGCGKSTELRRVSANQDINKKYWPVMFSVRDKADLDDMDYRDVLVLIGIEMYEQYSEKGGELPQKVLKELQQWKGKVEREIEHIISGRAIELKPEAAMDIDSNLGGHKLFAKFGMNIKMDPKRREVLRQVVEPEIAGLVEVINTIAVSIYKNENRLPLVLIDDLDKLDDEVAKKVFNGRTELLQRPTCAIVYTVSSGMFYSPEFEPLNEKAVFLPNFKLRDRAGKPMPESKDAQDMRDLVHKRMLPALVDEPALTRMIANSGGVLRQLFYLIRIAASAARRRKGFRIEEDDVTEAIAEIRNSYRRWLNDEDIAHITAVRRGTNLSGDHTRKLLLILALLEYRNHDNWCDANPVIEAILNERADRA